MQEIAAAQAIAELDRFIGIQAQHTGPPVGKSGAILTPFVTAGGNPFSALAAIFHRSSPRYCVSIR
jgi:hypothetical protein